MVVPVHSLAHDLREDSPAGTDEGTDDREQIVVEHEAFGAQSPAAVAVQQRDHDGHVGAACSQTGMTPPPERHQVKAEHSGSPTRGSGGAHKRAGAQKSGWWFWQRGWKAQAHFFVQV